MNKIVETEKTYYPFCVRIVNPDNGMEGVTLHNTEFEAKEVASNVIEKEQSSILEGEFSYTTHGWVVAHGRSTEIYNSDWEGNS